MFIPAYAVFVGLLALLVARHAPWRVARTAGAMALPLVAAAAIADVAEDVAILAVLGGDLVPPIDVARIALTYVSGGDGLWPRPWAVAKWRLIDATLSLTSAVFFGTIASRGTWRWLGYLTGVLGAGLAPALDTLARHRAVAWLVDWPGDEP